PLDGEYFINIRMQKKYSSGAIRGIERQENVDVRVDGRQVKLFTFGGKYARSTNIQEDGIYGGSGDDERTRYELSGDEELNVRVPIKARSHLVGVSFINMAQAEPETPFAGRMPVASIANFSDPNGLMQIDTVQIGPVKTTKASETPTRQQIF